MTTESHICQLSWFSLKSLSFSSNLPGNTYRGLFQNFFINFVIFEMSKRKIKQEVDLVLLFQLFSIGKHKTEQSNWCIFNECRSWSEINQSNCTIPGRKLARFSHAVIDVGNIRRVFRHCRKWHSYNAKTSRRLQIFVLRWLAGMESSLKCFYKSCSTRRYKRYPKLPKNFEIVYAKGLY